MRAGPLAPDSVDQALRPVSLQAVAVDRHFAHVHAVPRERVTITSHSPPASSQSSVIASSVRRVSADPNVSDNQRSTPLMFAAQHDYLSIVRQLLAAHAYSRARGTHADSWGKPLESWGRESQAYRFPSEEHARRRAATMQTNSAANEYTVVRLTPVPRRGSGTATTAARVAARDHRE